LQTHPCWRLSPRVFNGNVRHDQPVSVFRILSSCFTALPTRDPGISSLVARGVLIRCRAVYAEAHVDDVKVMRLAGTSLPTLLPSVSAERGKVIWISALITRHAQCPFTHTPDADGGGSVRVVQLTPMGDVPKCGPYRGAAWESVSSEGIPGCQDTSSR
jgi:hypothetical protein